MSNDAITTYYPPGSASGPAEAAITNGFVLTSDFTMIQAKTLASTLERYKRSHLVWRIILNNTTSQRSKSLGGPTCRALHDFFTYHRVGDLQVNSAPLFTPGSARADEATKYLNECPKPWWCAILDLPDSFSMGDQRVLKVAAAAAKRDDAVHKVSLLAFTHLLLRGPSLVVLHSNHWNVDVTVIRQSALAISGVQPPASGSGLTLAPATPPRSRKALLYYQPPAAGEERDKENLICDILSNMIRQSPTRWVDPTSIPKGGWRLLQQHVPPNGLAKFIREHKQFQLLQSTDTRWEFSFAEQDRDDPPDVHAPVSDSVCESEVPDEPTGASSSSVPARHPTPPPPLPAGTLYHPPPPPPPRATPGLPPPQENDSLQLHWRFAAASRLATKGVLVGPDSILAGLLHYYEHQDARDALHHRGMLCIPTDLAYRAKKLLFKDEETPPLRYEQVRTDPTSYEPKPGMIYVDGGNVFYGPFVRELLHLAQALPGDSHLIPKGMLWLNNASLGNLLEALLAELRQAMTDWSAHKLLMIENYMVVLFEEAYRRRLVFEEAYRKGLLAVPEDGCSRLSLQELPASNASF